MGMFIPPGTSAGAGGGAPGGSGTEIQYRSGATTFGAIAGSSVDPATGDTTFSARWISTRNSAANAPAHALTGTWFTGGTAESTKPHFLIEPTGATSTSWNVNGTGLGVNAPSGFSGDLAWLGVNGNQAFRLTAASQILGQGAALLGLDNSVGAYLRVGNFFQLSVDSIGIGLRQGGGAPSVYLVPGATNVLAQRNGGTSAAPAPQIYQLANYHASNTDFERAYLSWASNVFRVGTEKGTTGGTARAMELQTDGVTRIRIGAAGQIGVFGAAAVAQPAAIPDATDAASTQSGLNSVLAALRSLGWIAT